MQHSRQFFDTQTWSKTIRIEPCFDQHTICLQLRKLNSKLTRYFRPHKNTHFIFPFLFYDMILTSVFVLRAFAQRMDVYVQLSHNALSCIFFTWQLLGNPTNNRHRK
jgi:hypothetical protein